MPCWQAREKICLLTLVAADVAASKYPAAVRDVAATLKYRYHDFDHYNLKDPLDELLFIICSTLSSSGVSTGTWRILAKAIFRSRSS